jgi:hypothetical protein
VRPVATAEPTTAPVGYLDVAGLDHVTYRELTDRRAWLLRVIGLAGAGTNNAGARTAAVVLPVVINELDTRARTYKAAADHPYWCECGFSCTGLAAFDNHMDLFPPHSDAHKEVTEELFAAQQSAVGYSI